MRLGGLAGALAVFAFAMSMIAISLAQGAPAQDRTVPLSQIDNPQDLASVGVVDSAGEDIGKVVKVKTGSDGRASRLMVLLSAGAGAGRVAAMRAERLTFDRLRRVLVAQFSPAEFDQLAETATAMSGGIDASQSSGMVQRPLPSAGDAAAPMAH
jgi:hypothetical protein